MQEHYVKPIILHRKMTISDLVSQFEHAGVLGAGRLARSVKITQNLFQSPDYLVFLSMAGPMIAGGLRNVITDLIRTRRVHTVVTSGANVVHDLIEAIGGHHIQGTMNADDHDLAEEKIGRAGDIFVHIASFEKLEEATRIFLSNIPETKRLSGLAPSELISELGKQLDDPQSFIRQAYLQNVPVFCPGILDSMLGLHLALFSQLQKLNLNGLRDMKILYDHIFDAKQIGALILGGGLPKHFTLGSTILRGGLDSAIQITTARDEDGSLSGAKLQEGISWSKVKPTASFETVIGDATILFPLIVGAALDRSESVQSE